jgi:hypothetical protein
MCSSFSRFSPEAKAIGSAHRSLVAGSRPSPRSAEYPFLNNYAAAAGAPRCQPSSKNLRKMNLLADLFSERMRCELSKEHRDALHLLFASPRTGTLAQLFKGQNNDDLEMEASPKIVRNGYFGAL